MWSAIVILGFILLWFAVYDVLGCYPIIQKIFMWGSIVFSVSLLMMGYMLIAAFFNTIRNWLGL